MSEQRAQVRVWVDEGPGRAPEQRDGVLREPLPGTAVCLSGGGTRSMVAAVGQLRGLDALGLLDRVGYLACVSGSAWAAVPYLYAADGAERLGVITPPERLTLEGLDTVDAASLLSPATQRLRDAFLALDADAAVGPDLVWTRAVGETFLAPVGLYDPADAIGFGPAVGSMAAGFETPRQPTQRRHRPRAARPFPVVHATLNWPERRSDDQQRIPFEYTPVAVGAPHRRVLRDPSDGLRTVGGTMVQPVGFGCAVPRQGGDVNGPVTVDLPAAPLTLADMIGASSAFSAADRDVRAYPHGRYWTLPAGEEGPCVVNDLFTDGGDVDTLALLGILRRRIPAVVVFLNSVWPLSLDHDARRWPGTGQIDPALPPRFGQPSERWPHNQVFESAAYREVVSAWQAAKRAGRPLVATTRLRVLANDWWDIDGGWEVSVCWVYNDRVPDWETRLRAEVRHRLPPLARDAKDDAGSDASLARFPHYLTVGQNPGAMTRLTVAQANMLAELAGWGVLESRDSLRMVLG